MTCFARFIPAAISLALSGPIYALHKGEVSQYAPKKLRQLVLMMAVFMVVGVARAIAT